MTHNTQKWLRTLLDAQDKEYIVLLSGPREGSPHLIKVHGRVKNKKLQVSITYLVQARPSAQA